MHFFHESCPCDSLLNHLESVQVQLRVAVGFQFWQLWQFWQSPPSHSLFNPGQPEAGLCCNLKQASLIEENIPLAPLTTFKAGGPARYFGEATTEDDVKTAVAHACDRQWPHFVL